MNKSTKWCDPDWTKHSLGGMLTSSGWSGHGTEASPSEKCDRRRLERGIGLCGPPKFRSGP